MKIVLYFIIGVIVILFVAYQVVNYRFIRYQEKEYAQLASTNFKESDRRFPDSLRMPDDQFWALIEAAKHQHPADFHWQMTYLTDTLARLPDEAIVGFECTFREQIISLWNYQIKSLYQMIEGDYISSDDFLYFRGYLIGQGKEVCRQALQDPNGLTVRLDRSIASGEAILSVADNAYRRKHPQALETQLPRWVASQVNYDLGSYRMTGQYVAPDDFQQHYREVLRMY